MAVELMGNYGKDYAKTSEVGKIKQNSKSNTKTTLELNDFLKLMAAQLRNQDMNSPLNESEMMAQMAQMATMQAMTTMTDVAATTYSASLVGKEVTLAQIDEDNKVQQLIGKVTGAGLYNGKQVIFVGGKSYNLSQIMAVGELPDSENAIRVDEKGNEIKGGKKTSGEIGSKTAHLGENGPKPISDLERKLGYNPFAPLGEENGENKLPENRVENKPPVDGFNQAGGKPETEGNIVEGSDTVEN